jgi:diadenosine tetraphosphate (Ap4A) HIT family hydrolase
MALVDKEEWAKLHIAKFNNWTLSVCSDQHLLGWLIIFPPRKIQGSLVKLTDEELSEFKKVGQIAENLLTKAFNAEWFNYIQAGNVEKNLHIHLQPRYSSERIFENHTFTDEGWGHPVEYLPYEKLASKDVVFKMVTKLKDLLRVGNFENITVEIIDN